ncbi:hypothetical protein ASG43_00185 [Aureimonas sp. Leaf454]|uniref:hypothetical protein n=1 Tax=Aureimonas sp. Leaf454 TaxID=1736381 RepID=UPI0006FD1F1D|nr:hypothetical protein [Aureimonas sp. Leaf454]KQT54093.1 hypothetical protein ASG43_00185 [Aureimonas sp. Leaf454]
MSNRHKDEGAKAFRDGGRRADNPNRFGTHDWTDWKDGFDQAEAALERDAIRGHVAQRMPEVS